MAGASPYREFAVSATTAYVLATSIGKLAPISLPSEPQFQDDPTATQYIPYFLRLGKDISGLKVWANEVFKEIVEQWDSFDRPFFLAWQTYSKLAGKNEGLTGFLGARQSFLATRPPVEWAAPAVATIIRLEEEIKTLSDICALYAQRIKSGGISPYMRKLNPIRDGMRADHTTLGKLIDTLNKQEKEVYDKKVKELRDRIKANEKYVVDTRVFFEEGRYVTLDGTRYVASGVMYETWKKLVIGGRVKPARVNGRKPRAAKALNIIILGIICLGTAGIAKALEPSYQETLDRILADAKALGALVFTPFSNRAAGFTYKYVGQWLWTLAELEESLWATQENLTTMASTYTEKLSDVRQTLKWLKSTLRSSQVLTSAQVAKAEALIKSFGENWEFDKIVPALHSRRDQIGLIKVADPEFVSLEGAPTEFRHEAAIRPVSPGKYLQASPV